VSNVLSVLRHANYEVRDDHVYRVAAARAALEGATVKLISILSLLPALAVLATAQAQEPAGQGQSQDEQTIWNLEERYFANYAKGDTEALEGLWHANFTGWPSESPEPVRKSSASQSVRDFLARAQIVSFTLRPMAIAVTP